jgi:Tfp pilus assembly protein PilF
MRMRRAIGNLGAEYTLLGRFEDAETVMRRAIALDPATSQHQSNLALVLSHLGKVDEAEGWARRAVALDGSNARGHYVLGCVLAMRAETRPAAVAELAAAAREVPSAHRALAQVYDVMGKQELAREERERYENERIAR